MKTYEIPIAGGGYKTVSAVDKPTALRSVTDSGSTLNLNTPAPVINRTVKTPTPDTGYTYTGKDGLSYNNLTGAVVPTPPKSAKQIQADMINSAQGEISNLNAYEQSLLGEQKVINEKNDRSTAAISTLTGLAGSTEADVSQQTTTKTGQAQNEKIKQEAAIRMNTLLGSIRESALKQAKEEREAAQADETTRLANKKAQAEESNTYLTNLAMGGATFDGLKTSDPESFNYLAKQYGGEQALKGAFVLNTPQDQILDKKIENGKYIIAKQNPITGKINVETIDLGIPPGYSKTIDAGNRILAIPDNWDGNPSKLVTINKGLTPSQASTAGGGYGAGALGSFPPEIQAAAQSILDGKSKLNEYPQKNRLLINQAMSKVYTAEGGNELAQGAYDAILELEDHEGFSGAIGAKGPSSLFGLKGTPISGTDAAGFLADLDRLKANLKLVNIKYLKGTGALSDAEGKTLEDAGTSLNQTLPEAQFKTELARVKKALEKANKFTQENSGVNQSTLPSADEEQQLRDAGYTDEQIKALKSQ